MKTSFITAALLGTLWLAGCASVETAEFGPNGKPVHHIETGSATDSFDKAHDLCPKGYSLIGNPHETDDVYALTIECK
ncbi:hypothetical protein [Jeongeupia naejangsanensis]|uniref:Lipoprotein n=1 Tax=Jeongeupia naejangsanensis TaxID=613195 RepID=A0ABS2BGB6_9NEIS|nr:hypothetical protein [Jeongeupia naejangsanensis]MBM3114505.1 hypothetical protein [Jeongeupia naejangsanensis]